MKIIISFVLFFYLFVNSANAVVINKLTIKGNDRISSKTIKVFSGIDVGSNVDTIDINNTIKELYKTNFFKNVSIEIIEAGRPIPGDAQLVLLPGSKSTISDLQFMRQQGWDIDIAAHIRRGGHVLGICGGYQMLGKSISDPDKIESDLEKVRGLGLINVKTIMQREKNLEIVSGTHLRSGEFISGYEMHIGKTTGPDCKTPLLEINGKASGATAANGKVSGCYLHGMFSSDSFRKSFLNNLGASSTLDDYSSTVSSTLDELAEHLKGNMDTERFLELAKIC